MEQMSKCSCGTGSGNGNNLIRILDIAPAPQPPATNKPCSPPEGTGPVLVPGPSSAFSQTVTIIVFSGIDCGSAGGLPIICAETGVTLPSVCGTGAKFFQNDSGSHFYSTPGGAGTCCEALTHPDHIFSSGNNQPFGGNSIQVSLIS